MKRKCSGMKWNVVGRLLVLSIISLPVGAQSFELGPVNPQLIDSLAKSGSDNSGYVPEPVDWSHLLPVLSKDVPPAQFDWRSSNGLTSVKYQSTCGACWAFAACGVAEAFLKIHEGATWDFSENHMKNTHGFEMGHCAGGNNSVCTAYLSRKSGPVLEADDPYSTSNHTSPPNLTVQKLLTYAPIFTAQGGDRSEIQSAVMTLGPLATAMHWNNIYYDSATRTYYSTAGPDNENHMVVVVGWDDAKVVPGAPGPGAWICRNSYGSSWGEDGYFFISYHDTLAVKEGSGFFDLVAPDTYGRIYQYDPLGLLGSAGATVDPPETPEEEIAYAANVFTAAADENIIAVGTHAMTNNTAYEITVYDSGLSGGTFSNPTTSVSGVFLNAGYYVVDLPQQVSLTAGQQFSVVIQYQTPGYGLPVPIERPISGYAQPTAELGQSYLSLDGTSFSDIHGMGGTWLNTNACIKALAAYDPLSEGEDEGEAPPECVEYASINVPRPIDYFASTITESTLTISAPRTVLNMSVLLNISYPYANDLTVNLRSPIGTEITLFANVPQWGANFTNTILSDDADISINSGPAPFTGCYIPQNPLSAFNGSDAQGTWTLRIQSEDWFTTGSLTGWSLLFNCPCEEEAEGEPEGEIEGEIEGEGEGEMPPSGVYIMGRQRVEIGEYLILRAILPDLEEPITVEWYKNDVLIDGASSMEYHISEVGFEDDGVYHLVVTDASKAVYQSPPFLLRVYAEGSLPATGLLALGTLTALLAWAGAGRGRTRKR